MSSNKENLKQLKQDRSTLQQNEDKIYCTKIIFKFSTANHPCETMMTCYRNSRPITQGAQKM